MDTYTGRRTRGGPSSAEIEAYILAARRLRNEAIWRLMRRLATRIRQTVTTRWIEPFLWTERH